VEEGDLEICVGDVLNKGPKSLELLRYLNEEAILCVRGNHEEKFLRYRRTQGGPKANGIVLNELERSIYEGLEEEDWSFLESLPLYFRIGSITIVHAGILPRTRLERLGPEDMVQILRVRYLDKAGNFVPLRFFDPAVHFFWSELYDGRYGYVVYGHHPFLAPRIDRFSFGIDTGAVYGNRLTAILFEDGRPECYSFVSLQTRAYATRSKPWSLGDL